MSKKEKKPADSYDDVWHHIYDFENVKEILFSPAAWKGWDRKDAPMRMAYLVAVFEGDPHPVALFGLGAAKFLKDYGAWLAGKINDELDGPDDEGGKGGGEAE